MKQKTSHRTGAEGAVQIDFPSWLKQRRKALDLTQAQLAAQVGCVAGTVRAIESGTRRASRQIAERLAQVLEIAPGEQEAFVRWARGHYVPMPTPAKLLGEGNAGILAGQMLLKRLPGSRVVVLAFSNQVR